MPLVDALGNFQPLGQQGDEAHIIHFYVAVGTQLLHGDADAGLGHGQLLGDVDGTDAAVALMQNENGLQIVLGGFVNGHGLPPFRDVVHGFCLLYQNCVRKATVFSE